MGVGEVSRRQLLAQAALVAAAGSRPALAGPDLGRANIAVLPIRMLGDRLFTTIELEPGRSDIAVLDTGALRSTMSAERAHELKFRIRDKIKIEGLGGSEVVSVVRIDRPLIGGSYRPDALWMLVSETLDTTGFKLTMGGEWFSEMNSLLDLAAAEWRIFQNSISVPEGYVAINNSRKTIERHEQFVIEASLSGISGSYQIDTGSPTMMILDRRKTRELGLWSSNKAYAPVRLGGYGKSTVDARLYRLEKLTLQGMPVPAPLALLCDPAASNPQFVDIDGLVGLPAMRNFNMFFDGTAESLWLKPHGIAFDPTPKYAMSGLSIDGDNGRMEISDVGIGSAARAAGLARGDVIVGIEREDLRVMLNGHAGSTAKFEVERKGSRRAVSFVMQPYL